MLYEQGDYDLAQEILSSAEDRFPVNTQHAHIWMLSQQHHRFVKALHHGKLDAAEKAIISMSAISHLEASYWYVWPLRPALVRAGFVSLLRPAFVRVRVHSLSPGSVCQVYCGLTFL